MRPVGDAYDNAMCESFFATLEWALLDRRRFASQPEARRAVFTFIEGVSNPVRLLPALGHRSPARCEQEMLADPCPAIVPPLRQNGSIPGGRV
jgi:putative transposase